MNNIYTIGGYHGGLPRPVRVYLEKFCQKTEKDSVYTYEGTLDDFAECWKKKFMYDPSNNTIWVTQYSSFSQR